MASVKYIASLKQWRVRWHVTDPDTKNVQNGSRLLPKGSTRDDAFDFAQR